MEDLTTAKKAASPETRSRKKRVALLAFLMLSYLLIGAVFGELYYMLERSRGYHPGVVPPVMMSAAEPPPMPHFAVGRSAELMQYDWWAKQLRMHQDSESNPELKERWDSLIALVEIDQLYTTDKAYGRSYFWYFSFVTLATVGYGDVTPISALARFLVVIEIVIGISYVSLFVGIVGAYVFGRLYENQGHA